MGNFIGNFIMMLERGLPVIYRSITPYFQCALFALDITDAVLDYIATADLVDRGFHSHAVWLGACTSEGGRALAYLCAPCIVCASPGHDDAINT